MLRLAFFSLFALFLFAESVKIKDLVIPFDKNNKKSTFGKDSKYYSILIESKLSDDYDDFVDEFNRAAQKYENEVKFIFMNTDIEENWQAIEYLGIIAEDVPSVLFIILDRGLVKYKMPYDEITKANIEQFIEDALAGKALPFAKSEDVPKNWDSMPVKLLVGKNFEENVYVPGKTSFVFFYAPWCMACQNTMPEIEKLGLLYTGNKKVMIAKMDSTVNEVPQMPIFDVPTIALFVDGERKPIYYTGDERTATEFSAFIRKNMEKDDTKEEVEKKPKKGEKTKGKEDKKKKAEKEVEKDVEKEEEPKTKKAKKDTEAEKKKGKKAEAKKPEAKKPEAKKPQAKDTKKQKQEKKAPDEKKPKEEKKATEEKKPKEDKKTKKDTTEKKEETKKGKAAKDTKKETPKDKKGTAKKAEAKDTGKKKAKTDKKVKTEL